MSTSSVPPVKRCSKCGEEKPLTNEYFSQQKAGKHGFNAQCKKCIALYTQRVKDERREYQAEWRKNNPDKNRARVKRWRERHLEAARDADYRRYHSDPEKARARSKDYKVKNPEKVKTQRNAYTSTPHGRSVVNLSAQRYRAKKKAVLHDLTKEEWAFCLHHFGGVCAVCGQREGFWAAIVQDHWIPIAKGGATTAGNIIPLCHAKKDGSNCCNNMKSDRDPNEWLIERVGKNMSVQVKQRIEEYFNIVAQRK